MSPTLSYVYAVGRDVPEEAVAGLRGVDDGPVRLVADPTQAGLVGVVGDVDRAGFEQRALEEHLEDLAWLERTARAHHHVVDTLGRAHLVAPLALATVYYDDDRVRDVLERGRAAFTEVLDTLAGRSEWGVKVWARLPAGRSTRAAGERPRSGADYLRRRRQELRSSETGLDEAMSLAEKLHEAAGAAAEDTRRHRLQESALTGRPDPMVLNGAYLVAGPGADEFVATVRRWSQDERLDLEITGPWVPYSFAKVVLP